MPEKKYLLPLFGFSFLMGVGVFVFMNLALYEAQTVSPIIIGAQLAIPFGVLASSLFINEGINGISIGSNDLTELTLGVDRDNEKLEESFDERDPSVLWALERVITAANKQGITSSICGQAPSFFPDLTEKLVKWGITSVSVSPDSIDSTRDLVYRIEQQL